MRPRPTVTVGRHVYEIVEPGDLRAIVAEIEAETFARTDLTPEEQNRRYALALLAAGVNALLGDARRPRGPPNSVDGPGVMS